jgi:ribosomal protein S18 acetylase RimI-like enzyme
MAVTLKRMAPGDEAVFGNIAPEVFDEPVHPERLRHYLSAPGHIMVLALDGDLVVGQCAGVVHHHPDKPDELYIDEVGTASTHRRQGIAKAMMAELFAWGRELGCADSWLGTETDNIEANGLYTGIRGKPGEIMVYYEFDL